MPIEVESPEQLGYDPITNNLSESSVADRRLRDLPVEVGDLDELLLCYGDHLGDPMLRSAVAAGGDGRDRGRVLSAQDVVLPPILDDVRARLAVAEAWLEGQDHFEWVPPGGGVVGLVRARPEVDLDATRFYDVLLREHGTYVGPGHWFELDDRPLRRSRVLQPR